MRLTSFVVWRSWQSNRLRPLLAILGVALGIAIVVAIHVVDHNTIQSQILTKNPDFGRIDLEVTPLEPGLGAEELRAELLAHPMVTEVGAIVETLAALEVGGSSAGEVFLVGLWPLGKGSGFDHYRIERGADLTELDGDQACLIGRELAQELRLNPGDRLVIGTRVAGPLLGCIDGRVVEVGRPQEREVVSSSLVVKGILEPERLGRRARGRVVLCAFGLARRIANVALPRFHIRRAWGSDPDQLKDDLRDRFVFTERITTLLGEAADERAFRNGVKVLGLLALVLGMFVIFNTLSQ
jgi:hypothetical protein